MKEIRLGTIGSGIIVHGFLNGVQKTDGIRLSAVYSRTEEKGRELAAAYGAERVYTSLDDLFSDPDVNCIYIASPNSLHYDQAKRALSAGKHVICEKPFTVTKEQADDLFSLAEQKNLMIVEAAPTSFLPNFTRLKNAIPKIGRIRLVLADYSQYSSRYDQVLAGNVPNIFSPDFAGGSLMDINFYNVYLLVALFGKPENAVYYPNIHPGLVDTSGIMILQYPDFICEAAGAKDTFGVNAVQIQGEKGYIYVTGGSNGLAEIRVVTREGEERFNEQTSSDRWLYEVQSLTPILLAEDHSALNERKAITATVVETMEKARLAAGIRFPADTNENTKE